MTECEEAEEEKEAGVNMKEERKKEEFKIGEQTFGYYRW